MEDTRESKLFSVVARSTNTNAFGLYSHIMLAQDGEGWQALGSATNIRNEGDVLNVPLDSNGKPQWEKFHFECPEQIDKPAPQEVIDMVWKGMEDTPRQPINPVECVC